MALPRFRHSPERHEVLLLSELLVEALLEGYHVGANTARRQAPLMLLAHQNVPVPAHLAAHVCRCHVCGQALQVLPPAHGQVHGVGVGADVQLLLAARGFA